MWQMWLIIAGFFVILETITVSFFVFWFGMGALIAMISSLFIKSVIIQTVIFLLSSIVFLFSTRSFVNKMTKKDKNVKTNAFSIEGKIGKVISAIEPIEGKGQIKINGEVWSAKSHNDTYIPKDTEVTVEKIDGVKAIVSPLNQK